MKTGMIAALLALLATLTGCAGPQVRQHGYSATELSGVRLTQGQHVAVLLGRNAPATLDYLQHHRDQAAPASGQATPVATLGAGQAYPWLASSLAQPLADVTFYEDLDSLLADRPDVIVLLDARKKLASADNAPAGAGLPR